MTSDEEIFYINGELIPFLIEVMESKDKITMDHSARVQRLVNLMIPYLIKEKIITKDDIAPLWVSAILHDIGKIFVEDEILVKKDKLDKVEFNHIRFHPQRGYNLLKTLNLPTEVLLAVRHHHERWDGITRGRHPGYPDGLKGTEIPLYARIISVADAYDAMVGQRTYREPFSPSKAIKIIKNNAGKQFDPTIVNIFVKMYNEKLKK